jgi:iron(III) transport system permease protein
MAGDERLADAGPAAIMIVLAGLIPVILLSRAMNRRQTLSKEKARPLDPRPGEIYEPV